MTPLLPSLHKHPSMKSHGAICLVWPHSPHYNAAGLSMGPGVKLAEHEEFPIIRENMEKRGRCLLRKQPVPESRGPHV